MKYSEFDYKGAVRIYIFKDSSLGCYEVWKVVSLGRWYLVKKGKSIAWKNFTDKGLSLVDAEKWAKKWFDNALTLHSNLGDEIHNLYKEQEEIMSLLTLER